MDTVEAPQQRPPLEPRRFVAPLHVLGRAREDLPMAGELLTHRVGSSGPAVVKHLRPTGPRADPQQPGSDAEPLRILVGVDVPVEPHTRSEERRVGKEGRSRGWTYPGGRKTERRT